MKASGYNSLTSWLTLIACSLVQFFLMSVMRLAGIFFVILLDGYDTDRKKASVPIVIFGVLRTLTGPFTAVLGEIIGFRTITLTGCIFGAVGVGCCFFAEDITTASIFLGLFYGLGIAFSNTLVPAIIKLHFTKHISLVNGIALTGSCMGALVMSQVVTSLYNAYGMHGMFLILGGIFLNCIPAAILLKHPHNDRSINTEDKDLTDNSNQKAAYHQNIGTCHDEDKDNMNDPHKTDIYHQNLGFSHDEENQCKEIPISYFMLKKNEGMLNDDRNKVCDEDSKKSVGVVQKNKENYDFDSLEPNKADINVLPKSEFKRTSFSISPDIKLVRYFERQSSIEKFEFENGDLTKVTQSAEGNGDKINRNKISYKLLKLFSEPTFYCIMTTQSIHAFITTLNWTIIVDYARDKGISTEMAMYFSMLIPVSEIIGNMCFNWITDCHFLTRTNFNLICFLLLALDSGYIIWTHDFVLMMVGVLFFGLIGGIVGTTFPGIVIEYIKEEQQTMALASRFVLYAFLCMLKTPVIGYFRGTLGSYDWIYYIILSCCFACCILEKLTPVLASCRNRNEQSKENMQSPIANKIPATLC